MGAGAVLKRILPLALPEREPSLASQPGSIGPGTALSPFLGYRGLFYPLSTKQGAADTPPATLDAFGRLKLDVKKVKALPDSEQDAIAALILEELEDEAHWDKTFAHT